MIACDAGLCKDPTSNSGKHKNIPVCSRAVSHYKRGQEVTKAHKGHQLYILDTVICVSPSPSGQSRPRELGILMLCQSSSSSSTCSNMQGTEAMGITIFRDTKMRRAVRQPLEAPGPRNRRGESPSLEPPARLNSDTSPKLTFRLSPAAARTPAKQTAEHQVWKATTPAVRVQHTNRAITCTRQHRCCNWVAYNLNAKSKFSKEPGFISFVCDTQTSKHIRNFLLKRPSHSKASAIRARPRA